MAYEGDTKVLLTVQRADPEVSAHCGGGGGGCGGSGG